MKITANVSCVVDNSEVKLTAKAIQLPVRRRDQSDGPVISWVYFPLSQISYEEGNSATTVRIPKWLFDEKVGIGFAIK